MKTISNQELAKIGEDIAASYLTNRGYRVLCRNFQTKQGEVDIIVEKHQQIIFVEVKTRSYHSIQSAVDNVNYKKQLHITKTAQVYCKQNPQFDKYNTRFDVIIVLYDSYNDSYSIKHLPDAFLPIADEPY
ncbi:MAG: YraN family protein [Candidatus Cloacimonetes bacterium]|nr:YraN family protein [Candidatus Cloacimonadota bacterium]